MTDDFLLEVRQRCRGAAVWGLDEQTDPSALRKPRARSRACAAVVEVAEFVAQQVLGAAEAHELPACAARCHFCCYATVTVTHPEVQLIAQFLVDTQQTESLRPLLTRLEDHSRSGESLELTERFARGLACPLLDAASGACTIYEARPLRCRGANSLSAARCEDSCRGTTNDVDVNALLFDVFAEGTRGLTEAFAERGERLTPGTLGTLLAAELRAHLESGEREPAEED